MTAGSQCWDGVVHDLQSSLPVLTAALQEGLFHTKVDVSKFQERCWLSYANSFTLMLRDLEKPSNASLF